MPGLSRRPDGVLTLAPSGLLELTRLVPYVLFAGVLLFLSAIVTGMI